LHAKQGVAVTATLRVGAARHPVALATVRRAIRRGRIALRVRDRRYRHRRVRLVITVDRSRPTPPTALRAAGAPGAITLTWDAGRDDVGVTAYRIVRDGAALHTVGGGSRSFVDAGISPGSVHTYTVRAADRAGRQSRDSKTVTATVPSQTPSTGAGSTPGPVGDPPGWKQVFADDFDANVPLGGFPSAVSSMWSAYPDGAKDTSKNGTYYPSKVVSFHDGMMDMYLHSEGGLHLVVAPGPRLPGNSAQLYGRYAVRFYADPLPFYKVAWLLWPASGNWPHDGEIDFPEGDLDHGICGFVHHLGATTGGDQDAFCPFTPFGAWHTTVIEWTPTAVRFILDDQVIGTSTTRIPNTPMQWVLQTETADPMHGGVPSDATQGHILIDWVRAYRMA
jgi:beta-glucanase (GH16 family)